MGRISVVQFRNYAIKWSIVALSARAAEVGG